MKQIFKFLLLLIFIAFTFHGCTEQEVELTPDEKATMECLHKVLLKDANKSVAFLGKHMQALKKPYSYQGIDVLIEERRYNEERCLQEAACFPEKSYKLQIFESCLKEMEK